MMSGHDALTDAVVFFGMIVPGLIGLGTLIARVVRERRRMTILNEERTRILGSRLPYMCR